MNWRIDLSNDHVRECIKEECYEWLYEFDQLNQILRDPEQNSNMKDFYEGKVTFAPTYKFM